MSLNLIDFLKLPTRIICAIALSSCMILFLPDSIINKVYLTDFRNTYGSIIGIIFIVSTAILIVSISIATYKYLEEKYYEKQFQKNSDNILNSLDSVQKAIVYELFIEEDHTCELPLNSGAVIHLENSIIISKATNQYPTINLYNPKFPYFLQPWVIEKLKNNNELLLSFESAYRNVS